ncbi:MAG TPA: ABC transporter ATP-binding protein [Gaiellales bacterium]|jgi:spermidine/putrescine transport system ATP-binding protein|nr:ABC transporter ATP-binding protein [Gaiellales bacterium]
MAGEVTLVDLVKKFAEVTAVDGVNLEMPSGEFFSMLGPSGCGKTTTLRMIAGFEQPTEGRILLDGNDMAFTPPHKRNVNTVFQSYALFPHLNVFDNVAFGLRRKKVAKHDIRQRVAEALELVQLTGFEKRKPGQMSGGQQQRVALARALVLKPAVLLLDEPLGALDAKLRKALQLELKALQQQVGITFIYVTHDQEEALTMSDRIAVMADGRVEQVAAPREVYEEPATVFVADFLGVSNLMEAEAVGGATICRLKVGDFELDAMQGKTDARGPTRVTIRPERVRLEPHADGGGQNRIPGMVERLVYLGSSVQVIVHLAVGHTVQALVQNVGEQIPWSQGTPVQVYLPPNALRVLEDTGATLALIDENAVPA